MPFDLSQARAEVARRHRIPDWFTAWALRFEPCPPGEFVEVVVPEWGWVREQTYRGRQGAQCVEVRELEALEYVRRVWVGTYCAYIEIDPGVRSELQKMVQEFLAALQGDLRDFLEPNADDTVDWFRRFGSVASGLLGALDIGAVGDMVRLGDIVAKRGPLAEKIQELKRVLDTMAPFEIFRRPVGSWRVTAEDGQHASGQWRVIGRTIASIKEVACDRETSALDDGRMRLVGTRDLTIHMGDWLHDHLGTQPLDWDQLERLIEKQR